LSRRSGGNILFTGGGTAGHVLPCVPLIEKFHQMGWQTFFVGSESGLEEHLLQHSSVEFHAVSSGKLRRYFSWKNLLDGFRLVRGIWQAFWLIRRIRPEVVFSKGGYVSFPVVFSAWVCRVPVVAHESDTTPGLANRLALPFLDVLCTSFDVSDRLAGSTSVKKGLLHRMPPIVHTGTPMRRELLQGQAVRGRQLCGAAESDSILLVVGGSLGSEAINRVLQSAVESLCQNYFVVHICGRGNVSAAFEKQPRYRQFEFVGEGWGDLLAAARIVVSRAGANALYELLMLEKPNILVPLSARASRGDQIANAQMSEERGYSLVIQEWDLSVEALLAELERLESELDRIRTRLANFPKLDGSKSIADILLQSAKK